MNFCKLLNKTSKLNKCKFKINHKGQREPAWIENWINKMDNQIKVIIKNLFNLSFLKN